MSYGTTKVDTIQSSTASTPPTFKDGNGTQIGTLCRAWVNFGYVSSAITIRGSFNISSVTRTGTGAYTISFTNSMPDANYATLVSAKGTDTGAVIGMASLAPYSPASTSPTSTGSVTVNIIGSTAATVDTQFFTAAIFR